MAALVCILTSGARQFPFLHILTSSYLVFLMMAILTGVRSSPSVVLMCISLVVRDAEHLHVHVSHLCVLWRNVYSDLLPVS